MTDEARQHEAADDMAEYAVTHAAELAALDRAAAQRRFDLKFGLFLIVALLAGTAQAEELCRFERKVLFLSERPKASMVKRPPLIGPPVAKKPQRRLKHFDAPRRDGFDWICEEIEPIAEVAFERVPMLEAPAAPAADTFVALADLPTEPTGAGQGDTEAAPVFFAWPLPPLVAYGPVLYSPVAAVAEPESYALILLGLAAVILWKRRT